MGGMGGLGRLRGLSGLRGAIRVGEAGWGTVVRVWGWVSRIGGEGRHHYCHIVDHLVTQHLPSKGIGTSFRPLLALNGSACLIHLMQYTHQPKGGK